jgi:FKBP-type peptidyl-prolyl cis-trans isomerase SlyD
MPGFAAAQNRVHGAAGSGQHAGAAAAAPTRADRKAGGRYNFGLPRWVAPSGQAHAPCQESFDMEITEQCVVALTWVLKDTLGDELDVLDEPVEFLLGGDDLLKRIEEALQGHQVGATLDLHLEPEDAFGDYIDKLIFLEPRTLFPTELEEGMTFEGSALPEGCNPTAPKDALYTVTDIYPEHVVLDGNHPLAGIALRIHLKVEAVREATEEEIGRGSAGTGFFRVQPQAPGNDLLH